MLITRFNFFVLAAVAGGALWLEHSNRIVVEAPTPAEVAARNAAVCPANESLPFSVDCMTYIGAGAETDAYRGTP